MIVDSLSKMEIHMVENSWIIWDGIGEIESENDIQIQPLWMLIFDYTHKGTILLLIFGAHHFLAPLSKRCSIYKRISLIQVSIFENSFIWFIISIKLGILRKKHKNVNHLFFLKSFGINKISIKKRPLKKFTHSPVERIPRNRDEFIQFLPQYPLIIQAQSIWEKRKKTSKKILR